MRFLHAAVHRRASAPLGGGLARQVTTSVRHTLPGAGPASGRVPSCLLLHQERNGMSLLKRYGSLAAAAVAVLSVGLAGPASELLSRPVDRSTSRLRPSMESGALAWVAIRWRRGC